MATNLLTKGTGAVGRLLFGKTLQLDGAGAPTNGTSGTGAGKANPGSNYTDRTNGAIYVNTGTKASPVWEGFAGVVAGSIRMATLTLTNAQIKAIRATPITLVAAPGAGKVIIPVAAYAGLIYGGTNAFTAAANDNLSLKLKDGAGAILMSGAVQGFIQAVTNSISMFVPGVAVGATVNITKANGDNQPLVIHNQTAGEIAGNAGLDNTIKVTAFYAIVPSGL